MKLYRVVNIYELNNMLKNNTLELGACGSNFSSSNNNTFSYEDDKKYLHFFVNKDSCKYVIELYKNRIKFNSNGVAENFFIITAKIPMKQIASFGKGFYNPINEENHGYDYVTQKRVEAIIEATNFNSSFITRVEQIKNDDLEKNQISRQY